MSARVDNMADAVGDALTRLERLFKKDAKLTFIARFDDNEEADVFISADDPAKVLALIERTLARARGERQGYVPGAAALAQATKETAP